MTRKNQSKMLQQSLMTKKN
ncbi:hypothetical protein QR98_0023860 [Sarcoptes scabiei]|uniref:Uncharacterized protein n=1 Tax=Sarcoptes scabiei TaxID=52283 RepID=A0A131ZZ63_SARSC|nr:hypothetical protein QR98_0023860 [Sarcoptes scabiei]